MQSEKAPEGARVTWDTVTLAKEEVTCVEGLPRTRHRAGCSPSLP